MLRGEPFPTFKTLVSELSLTALLVNLMEHINFNALLDYEPGGWTNWEMSRLTRNNHDTLADQGDGGGAGKAGAGDRLVPPEVLP